jgi:SAM-dependent methyltransferase
MAEMSEANRYLAEHAHYTEDLALWRAISEQVEGPVLDIGAAAGRLALELARQGRPVIALDADPTMLRALVENAAREPAPVAARITTLCADMRAFALETPVFLAIAAMNTLQVLLTPDDQLACLERIRAGLHPAGEFWFDVAMPDVVDIQSAIGLVRAGDIHTDPATGTRLAHAFWFDWVDPITQTAQFTHRVDEIAPDGSARTFLRHHEVHIFTPVELRHLLARAGFEIIQAWGDFVGTPLESGAERQVYRSRVIE